MRLRAKNVEQAHPFSVVSALEERFARLRRHESRLSENDHLPARDLDARLVLVRSEWAEWMIVDLNVDTSSISYT